MPIRTTRSHARFLAAALMGVICVAGCGDSSDSSPASSTDSPEATGKSDKQVVIAVLPKLVNIKYFAACRRGAQKAADELGVKLIYDGPTEPSGSEQNKFIETWIRQGVDAICIAPNQPKTVKRFVQKAQQRGIQVICWDTDSPECGRTAMVNQVDDQELGEALIDEIAGQMNREGKWAIAIASLDAANLNTWRKFAEAKAKSAYPKMELVDTVVTQENVEVARQKVETLLNKHPDLKGLIELGPRCGRSLEADRSRWQRRPDGQLDAGGNAGLRERWCARGLLSLGSSGPGRTDRAGRSCPGPGPGDW